MSDTSGDPRFANIGPLRCGGCGDYPLPGHPCLGRIEFGTTYGAPGTPPAPPDFAVFQKPAIEQKLDRIIELLEKLVPREGAGNV